MLEFHQELYFLFWFYTYHTLGLSCLPSEDTPHKLINILCWLPPTTGACLPSTRRQPQQGDHLILCIQGKQNDSALPKQARKMQMVSKNRRQTKLNTNTKGRKADKQKELHGSLGIPRAGLISSAPQTFSDTHTGVLYKKDT